LDQANIVIIGGGVVGCAVARAVSASWSDVFLLEALPRLAMGASSRNSGVIHSGIYYKPGSLKALLCVEGVDALLRFCQENGVPYDICGKVIVAVTEDEIPRLEELFRRGQANGLQGLRMLSGEEIRETEPHATGIRGIRVPGTGIIDYAKVSEKYAEIIAAGGGLIHLSNEVVGLKRRGEFTIVETTQGPIEARLVINCAGLQSDRISRMARAKLDLTILPFRGEYYDIVREKSHYIKGLLYPVPDPQFPFLGVHFTKRIEGGVEAGPNAVLALKREGYSKTSFLAHDVFEYLTFPGFWIMAAKHWQMSVGEYHRSWSKAAFVRALQRLMPELGSGDLVPGGSGVRAQALGRDGKLIDDFHFVYSEGIVHVCNVPSPAATASLAIGKYIVDTVVQREGHSLLASN